MVKKVCCKNYSLTREKLANPFSKGTLKDRLIKSNTIDLQDNIIFKDFGDGYGKATPIDKSKIMK